MTHDEKNWEYISIPINYPLHTTGSHLAIGFRQWKQCSKFFSLPSANYGAAAKESYKLSKI